VFYFRHALFALLDPFGSRSLDGQKDGFAEFRLAFGFTTTNISSSTLMGRWTDFGFTMIHLSMESGRENGDISSFCRLQVGRKDSGVPTGQGGSCDAAGAEMPVWSIEKSRPMVFMV
jgi:hypothetical protein